MAAEPRRLRGWRRASLVGTRVVIPWLAARVDVEPTVWWFLVGGLNILGEELLWRGVLLPRQEAALGRRAWLANAAGWLLFHLAFGWELVALLLPILVVLPWVAQRRRSTWVAVAVHAGLNGPGFLAVAFGWV